MNVALGIHLILGSGVTFIGAVVGSFLNVCAYRIPWEKSVIWPDSRCPKCLGAIAAFDNVPVLGWIVLRGECRRCGLPISPRYPLVEAAVALLFLAAYVTQAAATTSGRAGNILGTDMVALGYHLILIAFLVVISLIDYDSQLVYDSVTIPGIALGLALGAAFPQVRPAPASATTFPGGLAQGLLGAAVGGALIGLVRVVAGAILRREAMGDGDIRILALIGAFLGWQAAVLTFFLAPFFGLVPAAVKIAAKIGKAMRGQQLRASDSELPFGPYLSMAAVALLLGWPWLWPRWAANYFDTMAMLFWFLLGRDA